MANADQYANGVNDAGEQWSVARYGTLVVISVGDDSDDIQTSTVEQAQVEYAELVASCKH